MTWIKFIEGVGKDNYNIINEQQEHIGRLEYLRLGKWCSWCLFLNEGCYLSALCIDEVRVKIKELKRTTSLSKKSQK